MTPNESHPRELDDQIKCLIGQRNRIDPQEGPDAAAQWEQLHKEIRSRAARRRAWTASTRALDAVDADLAAAKDAFDIAAARLRRFDRWSWCLVLLAVVSALVAIAAAVWTYGDLKMVIPSASLLGGGIIGVGAVRIYRREELDNTRANTQLTHIRTRTRSARMWEQINNGVPVTEDDESTRPTCS